MKKFLTRFEELWVAIAFAEAGAYEALDEKVQLRYTDPVRIHAI